MHIPSPGRAVRSALAAAVLSCAAATACAAMVDVSGVPLDDTAVVGGVPLKLNGAGYRKRGYFKIDVTALYTQQKVSSLDQLEKLTGPRRLELVIQQDLSGSQASRYFLIDFEASATPAEFTQLISEISQIGDIYSSLPKIKKGDVVTIDVIPGKGSVAALNGTMLVPHGASSPFFANELLARVMYRMYVGGKTPVELRDNLLGLSFTMHERPPAAVASPAPVAAPPASTTAGTTTTTTTVTTTTIVARPAAASGK